MPCIANTLGFGNGGGNRRLWRLRRLDAAGGEDIFNAGDNFFEDVGFPEDVAAGEAHDLVGVGRAGRGDPEGFRDDGIKFVQACFRPRDRFWDIPVPKIDSAFDNLLVPQPSWSPSTTQQLRKL
ncbi:hypothetical protein, partial [Thiolapillus sp.]